LREEVVWRSAGAGAILPALLIISYGAGIRQRVLKVFMMEEVCLSVLVRRFLTSCSIQKQKHVEDCGFCKLVYDLEFVLWIVEEEISAFGTS